MKNWTFGQQFAVLLGIAVVCSILSFVTRISWFHNLGWLLYGLLFVVHPVWPGAGIVPAMISSVWAAGSAAD